MSTVGFPKNSSGRTKTYRLTESYGQMKKIHFLFLVGREADWPGGLIELLLKRQRDLWRWLELSGVQLQRSPVDEPPVSQAKDTFGDSFLDSHICC